MNLLQRQTVEHCIATTAHHFSRFETALFVDRQAHERGAFPLLARKMAWIALVASNPCEDPARVATVHGFRSSFRDWCGECTDAPREIAEMALAHEVGTDVERAYYRSDVLEKRRKLVEQWSGYLTGETPKAR
nr:MULTISPECIES: hypothetical protein [unclassified Novosphingobium]